MVAVANTENNEINGYEGAALTKRATFMAQQVKSLADKNHGALTILDIGCGTGAIPFRLGALGYRVTGSDLDAESIASCNEKNKQPNVDFIVGDAKTMDLKRKFDVVIASEVIEHVPQPELLIKTMYRHLADGGIGIISIPNGYCLWEIVVSRFLQKGRLVSWLYRSPRLHKSLTGSDSPFYSKNVFCFHENFFSYGGFKKLVESNGFKIMLVRHSDLGILPEWSSMKILKKLECKIADYVPHALAGGWLLVTERTDENINV